MRVSLLLAGAVLSTAPAAVAQERRLEFPPAFIIDQWTTGHGLPQNSVNALARAPDGSLWIGTFGGLVRFDGTSFRLQERVDSSGRHVDRVLSLAADRDGALWVGTEDGLLRYRQARFESHGAAAGIVGVGASALLVDRSGELWVGLLRGGLVRRAPDGTFTPLATVSGLPLGPVTSIEEDAGGTLWVSAGDRLLTLSPGAREPGWAAPVPGAQALALEDRGGARWFSVPDGVASLAAGTARIFRRHDGVPRPAEMLEDPRGGYWIGTQNDGLFYFQPGERGSAAQHYRLPEGQAQYRVRSALVDDEGNVWFGTDANGLLRARRNLFTTFTAQHGLSNDVITAVLGDAGGVMWVATNCWGVNAVNLAARSVRTMKPRRQADPGGDPCVFALAEGPRGTIWAGTWGGGISRLRGGVEERLGLAGGLRDSVVLALFTDRDGTLWAGTSSGGLAALTGGRVRRVYTVADGLAHNSVRTIYQAKDGALWIGTMGGLSRFQNGRFTNYTAADGLSAEHVRSIYEDADGNLWIGTYGGGLNRLHDGRFTAVTQRNGLPDDVVSSIVEDAQGRLWMSGNRGIFRVARRELLAFMEGRSARVHSVLYGEADGLRNAETNGGFQPAVWQDAPGRLWYPTVRGVAMVDPAAARGVERPPQVSIEAVVVDGQPQPATGPIVVGPGRPNLEFRYTGLSLSAPEHLTFRYRLAGFEDEWVEAGSRRVAYYPRLPPGRYRFLVTAANRDGLWNEAESELRLRVTAPVWSTWWFRLAAALLMVALAVVVARRQAAADRLRREAREAFSRQLIESQEHERKRIAGELHDGLGQELLVVKNRALLALRVADLPRPAREQLEQIEGITAQSLDSVRGLARNLTPYHIGHLGLSEALRTMITSVAAGVDVSIHATVEDVDDLLPADREINLYRIVQEALNNVVRHAGASEASVHVRRDGAEVIVTVRDNGRGFRVEHDGTGGLNGGFGLSGIGERARILGGRLDISSAPGEGTRVEVSAPVAALAAERPA